MISGLGSKTFQTAEALVRGLRLYHRHEVFGLENVPRSGPGLVVFNHSLATYDSLLLGPAIYDHNGRMMRGLADRLIFKPQVWALCSRR